MYMSDDSTASLSEICLSLSQVTCVRSRAMILRKLSQANHVRRMMIARLKDERESASFILPSNHPNPSKKTTELKVRGVSLTKLQFSKRHTRSSEGFGGALHPGDGINPPKQAGRKCSSNACPSTLANRHYFKTCPFKQNEFFRQQKHPETPNNSTKDSDAEVTSDRNPTKFSKITPGRLRKQISIFSSNDDAGLKLNETTCTNADEKQTKTEESNIAKPIDLKRCSTIDASIMTISPNVPAKNSDEIYSEKYTFKTVEDYSSTDEIAKEEYPSSLLGDELDYSDNQQEEAQVTNLPFVAFPIVPIKIQESPIKTSVYTDLINDVSKKEELGDNIQTNAKRIPKQAITKSKIKKWRNHTKVSDMVGKDDIPVKTKSKILIKSFSKNTVSSMENETNSPVTNSSAILLESLVDLKKLMDLVGVDTTRDQEKNQYISDKVNELCVNTSSAKKRPRQNAKLAKQRLPSKIPVAASRIRTKIEKVGRKRTKKYPTQHTVSLDYLVDQKENSDLTDVNTAIAEAKDRSSTSLKTKQLNSGGLKETLPNASLSKEIHHKNFSKKRIKQVYSRLPVTVSRKENTINYLRKNYAASGDIEAPRHETSNIFEDESEALYLANDSCNANILVSSWLSSLPEQSKITSDGYNKKSDIGRSFNVTDTVGEKSELNATGSSVKRVVDSKKQIARPSTSLSLNKSMNRKLHCKSCIEVDCSSTLPSSSFKPNEQKESVKSRKSVVDTEKLLGKLNKSFSATEFLDSPIEKFMSEINSAMIDSEPDESDE